MDTGANLIFVVLGGGEAHSRSGLLIELRALNRRSR